MSCDQSSRRPISGRRPRLKGVPVLPPATSILSAAALASPSAVTVIPVSSNQQQISTSSQTQDQQTSDQNTPTLSPPCIPRSSHSEKAKALREKVSRCSWALLPLGATTIVCGIGMTSIGLYAYLGCISGRIYLGFGVLAGLFSAVAGGAGMITSWGRILPPVTSSYVVTAFFSVIASASLLLAVRAVGDEVPEFQVGLIGGALCSLAATVVGLNVMGIVIALTTCRSAKKLDDIDRKTVPHVRHTERQQRIYTTTDLTEEQII